MGKDPIYTATNPGEMNDDRPEALAGVSVRRDRGSRLQKRLVWSGLKVALYVVFLVTSVGVVLAGVELLAKSALRRSTLGQVYPGNIEMARRDFTTPASHYDYDFVPGVCLEYNTAKGNRYEYANNAGFRDPRDITVEKPKDEFRIFLLGGSTAYGLGSVGEAAPLTNYYSLPFYETLGHMLEMILNATVTVPGKKIRVYNAAVWGYAYQHHLMRYMAKLRRYNPDLVISLDGANEIAPVCKLSDDWDYFREGQFNDILREMYAYNRTGLVSYLTLWLKNNTYLMTFLWGGKDAFTELHHGLPTGSGTADELPGDSPNFELTSVGPKATGVTPATEVAEKSSLADRNVSTVVRVVEDLHSVLENDGVPHMFVLQPWLYLSKKKLTQQEKTLASLEGARLYYGVPSDKMYALLVNRIVESARQKGYFLVDFSSYFDDVSEWVFTDWCHLTSGANYVIAKELANLVKESFFGQPLGKGDAIDDKNGLFWDLAASSSVLRASRPDSPKNGPKNILAGYPGAAVYSSAPGQGEPLEVVLDMGQAHPVSRTRLVWADEESVPEKWTVEVSGDGTDWRPLVVAAKVQLDSFSRWPGFEYYAAEPVRGRYLRYKPMDDNEAPIRLRCWNVFR
jgi:hypothetical protein